MANTFRRTRGKPTDVDRHVGQRLRQRRQYLGLSQTKLADLLEMTFQQVQKYERGSNRVGAGRLYQMMKVLDVPAGYFFEGLDGAAETPMPATDGAALRLAADIGTLPPSQREAVKRLVRTLAETPVPDLRRAA